MAPIIKYNIIKDNQIIYANNCPLQIFGYLMPLVFCNTYDFIEIFYENNTYIWNAPELPFDPSVGITKEEHVELINQTWFSKDAVKI